MSDPYRADAHPCPSCGRPLRWFRDRLVCDACGGILAPLADLAAAIDDITGVVPRFEFLDQPGGVRPCPACGQPMTRCHLRVELDGKLVEPRPELDRCAADGVWFDADELAAVFEVARKHHPGGARVMVRTYGGGGGASGNDLVQHGQIVWWNIPI